jgi:hypothetical protein
MCLHRQRSKEAEVEEGSEQPDIDKSEEGNIEEEDNK